MQHPCVAIVSSCNDLPPPPPYVCVRVSMCTTPKLNRKEGKEERGKGKKERDEGTGSPNGHGVFICGSASSSRLLFIRSVPLFQVLFFFSPVGLSLLLFVVDRVSVINKEDGHHTPSDHIVRFVPGHGSLPKYTCTVSLPLTGVSARSFHRTASPDRSCRAFLGFDRFLVSLLAEFHRISASCRLPGNCPALTLFGEIGRTCTRFSRRRDRSRSRRMRQQRDRRVFHHTADASCKRRFVPRKMAFRRRLFFFLAGF